jgi:ABC-type cobalamin/Fe3+-siderophores transport system ATPase subunit
MRSKDESLESHDQFDSKRNRCRCSDERENVGSQFNIPRAIQEGRHGAPLKTIIDNSHGCAKPEEMLLVLGRPGAGCTTLLKMLANRRMGYAGVIGDVSWRSLNPKQAEQCRGHIVMNAQDEPFFPTLTVGETTISPRGWRFHSIFHPASKNSKTSRPLAGASS